MKRLTSLIMLLSLALCYLSCSTDENIKDLSVTPEASMAAVTESMTNADPEWSISSNPDDYEIVVIDIDRWKIMLNTNRKRRNLSTYYGSLYYKMGSSEYLGHASAMYNPEWEMLTIVAHDVGWGRGKIIYNLKFESQTGSDMEGTFVYYEYPRQTNWIGAWLDKGSLGEHVAIPVSKNETLAKETVSDKHPKIER